MSGERFGDRVVDAMKRQKVSRAELARRSGVSYDVLRELERRPDSTTSEANAVKIAAALGLTLGSASVPAAADDAATIPIYDVAASAGAGTYVDHEVVADQLRFPPNYLRTITSTPVSRLAIIGVKGNSMLPTLKDGDLVMLDTSKTHLGYDGMFVLQIEGVLHVKRIGRTGRAGHVLIRSDNEAENPPYEVPIDEVKVIGRVLWSGRKE